MEFKKDKDGNIPIEGNGGNHVLLENEDVFSIEDDEEIKEESESKKTRLEKKVLSVQEKLLKLKEKIKNNPPKTVIGKRLVAARLNRIENILDRRKSIVNIINLAKQTEFEEANRYNNVQNDIMWELSDLYLDRENLLRSIERLERLNPQSENSIFSEQQKRIAKNMPKGYKAETNSRTTNSKVNNMITQYEEELKKLEEKIEEKNIKLQKNDQEYEKGKAIFEEQVRSDLALVTPNIFKRIGKFFEDKKTKFNEWRKQRKDKAVEKLVNALERADETSKRGILLSDLNANISQEEQHRIAKETTERLNELSQNQVKASKEPEEPTND